MRPANFCSRLPVTATKAELATAHRAKMDRKAEARASRSFRPRGVYPASINRNTGQPHEHKREIARRARQAQPADHG